MSDATVMLAAIKPGKTKAAEQMLVLVYDELRRLTASKLAQTAPDQTPGQTKGRASVFQLTRGGDVPSPRRSLPGTMWGVSSAALARIGFRVATDERWEPDSDAYLGKLRRWCQSLAEVIETPDVLRLYAAARGRGGQIVLAGR